MPAGPSAKAWLILLDVALNLFLDLCRSLLGREIFAGVDTDRRGDGGRVHRARPQDDHRSRGRKFLGPRLGRKVGQVYRRAFPERAEIVRNRDGHVLLVSDPVPIRSGPLAGLRTSSNKVFGYFFSRNQFLRACQKESAEVLALPYRCRIIRISIHAIAEGIVKPLGGFTCPRNSSLRFELNRTQFLVSYERLV